MTFRILTVCTGNICRSPAAEILLRSRLAALGTTISVSSAGTNALEGHGMPRQARQIVENNAGDAALSEAELHAGRPLNAALVKSASLVLALGLEHRAAVLELVPAATSRTFTLREFARIIDVITEEDLTAAMGSSGAAVASSAEAALLSVVRAAAPLRGFARHGIAAGDDDVVDPYRRSRATYDRAEAQLAPAVDDISRFLLEVALTASAR